MFSTHTSLNEVKLCFSKSVEDLQEVAKNRESVARIALEFGIVGLVRGGRGGAGAFRFLTNSNLKHA